MIDRAYVPIEKLTTFNGSIPAGMVYVASTPGGPPRLLAGGHVVHLTGDSAGSAYPIEAMDASGVGIAGVRVEVDLASSTAGGGQALDVELKGNALHLIGRDDTRASMPRKVAVPVGRCGGSAAGLPDSSFARWRLVSDQPLGPVTLFER